MKERHHTTPLGVLGMDVPANIAVIDQELHAHIHQTCNIPFREHSRLTRAYRRRFNHRRWVAPDEVEFMLKLQRMYFGNHPKLSPEGKAVHVKQMNVYTQWLRQEVGHYHEYQKRWSKLFYEYQQALKNYFSYENNYRK